MIVAQVGLDIPPVAYPKSLCTYALSFAKYFLVTEWIDMQCIRLPRPDDIG